MMPVLTADSDPEQVVHDATTNGRTESDRAVGRRPKHDTRTA
ncbi:hypothetical protein [Rathayibacter sp. Leaf248]|nr:hypothetical protein [Rathayibacter sp. Leaf248]